MQIVYHIGAHCTDEDAFGRSLIKNADDLHKLGVSFPNPGKYKNQLRDIISDLASGKPLRIERSEFLDLFQEAGPAERVILTTKNFLCVPNRIFEGGDFYGLANEKLHAIGEFFAEDDIEIMLSVRDPSSFIPAAFANSTGRSFESFIGDLDLDFVNWSDFIDRIQDLIPDVKITVWCSEDAPYVWPHVLRSAAGLKSNSRIIGGYDIIGQILTPEGIEKLQLYFKKNPPKSEQQRVKVLAAFVEKFAKEDALVEEVENPGWTDDIITQLSAAYDEDIAEIAARDDINFIRPMVG